MSASRGASLANRESRRAELIAQLGKIEAEQRKPDSPIGPEVLSKVANALRWQIEAMDERNDDDAVDD